MSPSESPGEATTATPSSDLTSVITVSFNSGAHLAACVRSVLASSEPVEVLVVDNGSTDDGLDRLRGDLNREARVRILENGANLGFARANNRAIGEARGRWILLLNPDCTVEPTTVGRVREVLESEADAGMAGCLILNPDGTEQAGCRRERPTPKKALVRALGLGGVARRLGIDQRLARDFVRRGDPLPERPVEVDAISGAFMLVRRDAIQVVGGLDEGYFLHCEDLDWCERFRRAGWRVLFVPSVVVVHDKGASSRGRPVRVLWHMHRGMIRYYVKFFRDQHPLPLLWLVVAGVWVRFGTLVALGLTRRLLGAGEPRGSAGDRTT